ncbi:hypothetical protein L596_007791 [Steinernema carpocapsae]|uniref:Target of rapamycin complex subunit lst8 n=1 Tax=Steinernema carpocapsae TaxID=34508 RepID=A0A4U5PAF5_STECR|nr:hypothetical protein L596_007791 [Steinernema carpocapsae]
MQPMLASASYDATIRFWDLNRGSALGQMNHKDSQVNAMEFSADGMLLALGCWHNLKLVDMQKQAVVDSTEGNRKLRVERNVTSLFFIPESTKLVSGGEDQTIRLWNSRGSQLQCEKILELPNAVNSVCMGSNSNVVFATDGRGCAYQWDVRTNYLAPFPVRNLHFGEHILSIAASGNLVAGATNHGRILIWDAIYGNAEVKTEGHNDAWDGPVKRPQKCEIQAHRNYATRVRFTPNGERLASTSADGSVCLWDPHSLENLDPVTRFVDDSPNPVGWVWDCAFTSSHQSKYMYSASADGLLRCWEVESARVKMYFRGHNKPITAMTFRDTR